MRTSIKTLHLTIEGNILKIWDGKDINKYLFSVNIKDFGIEGMLSSFILGYMEKG